MDNQHKIIKGYRDLTQSEIDMMNRIKSKGEELGALVADLELIDTLDHRWVSIGKTHLQQGTMALVRSVAQPSTF